MVFTVLLSLLLSVLTTADSDGKSCKTCPEEVLYYAHGKCVPLFNKLMMLSENVDPNGVSLDVAKNITDSCQELLTCLEPNMDCCETLARLDFFEQKCDKLNMKNYELLECMINFYGEVYEGKNDCSKDFEFLERNQTQKQKAFKDGKSCFQKITSRNCSEKSNYYIQNYYDEFVEILTTPPKNDDSESSYGLWDTQCEVLRRKFQDTNKPTGNFDELCMSLENCSTNQEDIPVECSKSPNTTKSITNFEDCFKHISSLNLSQYKCVKETTYSKFVAAKRRETVGFSNDKECLRAVMAAECDEGLQKTFDEDWKALTKMGS